MARFNGQNFALCGKTIASLRRNVVGVLKQMLTARGCPKLNLQVRAGNDAVLAFYASLGYVHDHSVCLGKRLIADN